MNIKSCSKIQPVMFHIPQHKRTERQMVSAQKVVLPSQLPCLHSDVFPSSSSRRPSCSLPSLNPRPVREWTIQRKPPPTTCSCIGLNRDFEQTANSIGQMGPSLKSKPAWLNNNASAIKTSNTNVFLCKSKAKQFLTRCASINQYSRCIIKTHRSFQCTFNRRL